MDVKDLKRLLDSLKDSDVSELTLETSEYKLSVKRGEEPNYAPQFVTLPALPAQQQAGYGTVPAQQAAPSALNPSAAAPPPREEASAPEAEAAPSPAANTTEVTAPIVGTLYLAASPDAPPYVKVGDKVQSGTVLCIIEAMKLMNEIEAEFSGVVREILVENEDAVEYGQPLFRLEPA